MFYRDYFFPLLTHQLPELDFGPVVNQYRLDKSHEAFYFFPRCPEEVLDVSVFKMEELEIHQVDSTSFTPKRFLFISQTHLLEAEYLDDYLAQNSFERKANLFDSRNMVAFLYKDGMVFASRSCRKNFGEAPGMKIR
jgi:hypothetical protein